MSSIDLVNLSGLMGRSSGSPRIVIGLIDGPVVVGHPNLTSENIHVMPGKLPGICTQANSDACTHGTFIAGILSAKRGSGAPAICPDCTLLVRPIFAETSASGSEMPSASAEELSVAIIENVKTKAQVINLSVALSQPSSRSERSLEEALDYAADRGTIVVAASGNQGALGSTVITRHPGVIPVVAYDSYGRPMHDSNWGISIGKRGLGAPGRNVISLGANGKTRTLGGTSAAAPFVTGSIALLWSVFPKASPGDIRHAIMQTGVARRTTVIPPLLNAGTAYDFMLQGQRGR